MAGKWVHHTGRDVQAIMSGVMNLDVPSNLTTLTLDECKAVCSRTDTCNSIVWERVDGPYIGRGCVGLRALPTPVDPSTFLTHYGDGVDTYTFENKGFDYQNGVQIGPKDFAQVYAGDVDGVAPDDVVAVYENGAVEVFLTKFDPSNALLVASGGVGFHSMGIVVPAGIATVTTVNFIGTLHGFGTTCRFKDSGCTSPERAVFIGTSDTDDYLYVSPRVITRSHDPSFDKNINETECHASYGATCRSSQATNACLLPMESRYICPIDYPTCVGSSGQWHDSVVRDHDCLNIRSIHAFPHDGVARVRS